MTIVADVKTNAKKLGFFKRFLDVGFVLCHIILKCRAFVRTVFFVSLKKSGNKIGMNLY